MNYKDIEPWIMVRAWKYSFNVEEYEELTGVGRDVVAEVLDEGPENPAAAIKCRLDRRMIDATRKWAVRRRRSVELMEMDKSPRWLEDWSSDDSLNPERLAEVNTSLATMSEDAKEIVRIIFAAPEEILGEAKNLSPRNLRGQLARSLRKRGWAWAPIHSAIKEIRNVVASF